MGGNLLQKWELPPKRASRDEYVDIENILIREFSGNSYIGFPRQLPDKETFGDVDFVLSPQSHLDSREFNLYFNSLKDFVHGKFGYKPHVNGNVISFPVNEIQVDCNVYENDMFHSALSYGDFGDISNLIGRMAYKLGLHLGHNGLSYWLSNYHFDKTNPNSHVIEKIVLITHYPSILKFLDLDSQKWRKGFSSLEDVFEWIIQSKYFSHDLFKMENLNHVNRKRNSKRSQYNYFLEWCENNKDRFKPVEYQSKDIYLYWCMDLFPYLRQRIEFHRKNWEKKQLAKSKFNGTLILQWLGLKQEDWLTIKKLVDLFKSQNSLEGSWEEVKQDFLKFYETYLQNPQ
jgi:hypothetical protein